MRIHADHHFALLQHGQLTLLFVKLRSLQAQSLSFLLQRSDLLLMLAELQIGKENGRREKRLPLLVLQLQLLLLLLQRKRNKCSSVRFQRRHAPSRSKRCTVIVVVVVVVVITVVLGELRETRQRLAPELLLLPIMPFSHRLLLHVQNGLCDSDVRVDAALRR